MILQILSFLGLLGIGVPIAFSLLGTAVLYIAVATDVPMTVPAQRMFVGLDDFTLMSIPLFIYAGYLMNETGLTERLVDFAALMLRRVYGGLSHANVAVSMAFGGVSGVAAADVAAVGTVMIPAMERDGYDREYATAITLASSLIGPIIPPSVPFIIYGVQSETSIGDLFLAGAIPGIIIGLGLMATGHFLLKRRGFVSRGSQLATPTVRQLARSLASAIIALAMPLVVIGGIVGGVFTPTEAAGIAVIYAFLSGFVFFRTLTVRRLARVSLKSAVTSTVVMLILAGSVALNWVLSYSRIPTKVADLFLSLTDNRLVFIFLVIVLLLIIGIPLDPVPALIIMTPILLPAAISYGIDPVHFGVIMVVTLVLGLITPPVGASLFVATAITDLTVERLSIAVLPFLAALIVLTLLISYIPQLSLWLPNLLGG